MDFEGLKKNLFAGDSEAERVQVNQRHLIDKILARYSAKHTIYRELLQNSNDAQASKVIINFTTVNKKITALSYQNNGKEFSSVDFSRLTKIAQGNPDEQKIGFFGVGFYSLFSICEEPFLSSGGETMGFFWKGDALYTKRGIVPPENITEWTTFWLSCREPLELPKYDDFARFLATSLAFTTHVKQVEVLVDGDRIQYFHKKVSVPRPLDFKSGDYELQSPSSIFKLRNVDIQNIQLDVNLKEEKTFFLASSKIVELDLTLFTRIALGILDVTLPRNLEKEMERTTKKSPPKTVNLQLIYSNYDEYSSSTSIMEKTDIFTDLMPGPEAQGHIFIGFQTFQTTGCSIQLSAHLIPTVERESIDFVDKSLSSWNQELLSMGGLLARIVAEDDMDSVSTLFQELKLDSTSEEWLQKKANHNLSSFTFNPSTPSSLVSRIVSTNFYKLSSKPLRMVSTKGILPVSSIRLNDPELSNFFIALPLVPASTESQCKELVKRLLDMGSLKKASLEDLFYELSQRPLTVEETTALFKYWINQWRKQVVNRALSERLSSVLLVIFKDNLISMMSIKYYALPQLVPPDLPIHESVMPLVLSKQFVKSDLEQALWGLKEYTLLDWLGFITKENNENDFGINPTFTEAVMAVLSRHFGSMPQKDRLCVASTLSQLNCVVTRLGMKKPQESYFSSVNLFEDLAIVHWSQPKTISLAFQKAIGIREHVELQLVFDRLMDLNWNHTQLIKYLSSVKDKLTPMEFNRLKATPMFPKEIANADGKTRDRFHAKDLYAPTEKFRSLGLPLIDWNGKWRHTSEEAKFMEILGLNTSLPLDLLIRMAANSNSPEVRMSLIMHLIDNYQELYSKNYRSSEINLPFLPVGAEKLAAPQSCFSEPGSSVLGFMILQSDLKHHSTILGVRSHPSNSAMLLSLKNNPPSLENAERVLSYVSSRQYDFDRDDWQKLKNMKFIPVIKNQKTIWMAPASVYFGKLGDKGFKHQFTYIDFGVSCNAFLSSCGVKDEPSTIELANMIIHDPNQVMKDQGIENYLGLLRQIAVNYTLCKANTQLISKMKTSPFLIGIKSKELKSESSNDDVQYQLSQAKDIYLIDDTVFGLLFNALGAPVESVMEAMYEDLGSPWLSTQVKEVTHPIGNIKESSHSNQLQFLINQRAPLLLYDGHHLRNAKDIVPQSEKLLKNLKVVEASSIEITRNFLGVTKTQNTTACMLADRKKMSFMLYTTKELDYFDVDNEICRIIFMKPILNDSLLLSTLLSTSLENLKRKGFPVDRILNLKKAVNFVEQIEQKETIDKIENVRRSSPDENEKINQLSSLFPRIDRDVIRRELKKASGSEIVAADALAEISPDIPHQSENQDSGVRQMFNTLKKNLGFKTDSQKSITSESDLPKNPQVEMSQKYHNTPPNTSNRNISPGDSLALKEQLSKSISRLMPVNDSRIHAKIPMDPPSNIPIQKNTCEVIADSDLILIETIKGVRFYIDKTLQGSHLDEIISKQHIVINRFSVLLQYLAQVFRIDITTIAMYWDQTGDTIAFNRARSLFFNSKYYNGLHFPNVKDQKSDLMPGSFIQSSNDTLSVYNEDLNTFFFWFMVFCHELAHNFASAHDSNHEFWMSSYAEQYLGELILLLKHIGKI